MATLPAPDDLFLAVQTALAGEYSIERELGRGGMGVVYLAREVRLAREVAIKILPPALAESRELREQFVREAQTAARLSHPNIVPIHRVDDAGGFVYFVMAYVPGETLAQRVQRRGPLPPHAAAKILREVSWALTYAHSSALVHRDIKADNILLERGTERAIVTDFGIAKIIDADGRTPDGRIAGSPHYVSPEQIAGEPAGQASDIYSLGVVGFLTLTGRLPFDAPTAREVVAMHLNTRAPSILSLAPTVPAKLAQAVDRCLAKRAVQRYPTASAFAEALEQAVEPPREIPAPIRVWLERTNHQGGLRLLLSVYGGLLIGGAFAAAAESAWIVPPVALATILILGILPSVVRTNRVVAAGYGIDDLRAGIREYWLRRREEAVYELTPPGTGVTRKALRWLLGGSALATVVLGLFTWATPVYSAGMPIVMSLAATFAVSAGVLAIGDQVRRRRIPRLGKSQIKFFNSKWGERFVRLCGFGVKNAPTVSSLPQLTEVALGRATDALYDALPKAIRKQLKDLPKTVRRLEDDAKTLRAELEKLDASIATLDGDARDTLPSAITDSSHETRIRAERDRVLRDLRATRERAADRLAATVAALENIRLDLLRLQLGDGQISSVTASLEAAQRIAADIGAYVEATSEVEATLARRSK